MRGLTRRVDALERTTIDSGEIIVVQRDDSGRYFADGHQVHDVRPIVTLQPGYLQRLQPEGGTYA